VKKKNETALMHLAKEIHTEDPEVSASELRDALGISYRYATTCLAKLRGPAAGRAVWKTGILSDAHVPYQDTEAYGIAVEYLLSEGIDTLWLNGDYADFYKISHWRTNPARMAFVEETLAVRAELQRLAKLFPDARKVYVMGNHERRLRAHLWTKDPELAELDVLDFKEVLRLRRNGFKLLDIEERMARGQGVPTIGDLAVIHGHEDRVSQGVVNFPRIHYQRAKMPILVGHHHVTQERIEKRIDGRVDISYSVGCLCPLSQEYSIVNNWNHGFAVAEVDCSGHTTVRNLRILDGHVLS